ncbi:MAG TPA: DUF2799 domain-containing protein [Steroidobacteraceae bacterium]|nr:DUF2799 domain-containing protein [Steroidobacteraceae bacterium]
MNRSLIKLLAALALLGSLSGCASLSKSDCLSADWESIGVRDGANGQPEEYLQQHFKACAKVQVVPDRGAWLHGRERGLDRYCVPQRAYQAGEYGNGFNVYLCGNYDQDRLDAAWAKGHDVNTASNAISSIDGEMRDVRHELERDDLERKERERLAFRLGQLVYERGDAQRAYDEAVYRARTL